MYLVRDYPTPSDRMGLLWALSGIQDLIIVEFGPEGTTRYLLEALKQFGHEARATLYTTTMDEDVVIFGNADRLIRVLQEVDQRHKPEVIIVMDSSVASVIGMDMDGICKEAQNKIAAKLLVVKGGGLGKNWSQGIEAGLSLLANLTESDVLVENGYNLIGCCADEYNHLSEATIIEELMKKLFGMELFCNLPGSATIEECKQLGKARLNIVIRSEGCQLAEWLFQKHQTPYVYLRPYGLAGTKKWAAEITRTTGIQANYADFADELAQLEKQINEICLTTIIPESEQKTVVLSGLEDLMIGLSSFIMDELKLPTVCLKNSWCNKSDHLKLTTAPPNLNPADGDSYFVMADGLSVRTIDNDDCLQITHPIIDQLAIRQPGLMGFSGALFLINKLNQSN